MTTTSMSDYAQVFCRKLMKPLFATVCAFTLLFSLGWMPGLPKTSQTRIPTQTQRIAEQQLHQHRREVDETREKRTLPGWFDEAKIGVFVHWGVFSVPSFGNDNFWRYWKDNNPKYKDLMDKFYPPGYSYEGNFTHDFRANYFEATEWVKIFKAAGAKYAIINSKHQDGFSMWKTKYSKWNSFNEGPKRDIVGEFAKVVKATPGMEFGVYHSLKEWYNPLWIQDKAANFTTSHFVNEKIIPEMKELVELHKPLVFWSDGQCEAPGSYWNSSQFLTWLFNESPVQKTVVTNDKWGYDNLDSLGGFFLAKRQNMAPGNLESHKWENSLGLDRKSWGFRREAEQADIVTYDELIEQLVSTVSSGGNLLVIIGATPEGRIPLIFQKRLREMGAWLKVNGEAIYGSSPWTHQNETSQSNIWYTKNKEFVYATVLQWPRSGLLTLTRPKLLKTSSIYLLGYEKPLQHNTTETETTLMLPEKFSTTAPTPWVLKLTEVTNLHQNS